LTISRPLLREIDYFAAHIRTGKGHERGVPREQRTWLAKSGI